MDALLKLPADLSNLNREARLVILVDAVSMLRNMFVRTFHLRNRKEVKTHMSELYASLDTLIAKLQLNLPELIKESRRALARFEI